MKRPAAYKIVFILFASLLLMFGWTVSSAQQEVNLLQNPGFEGGFRTVSGQPDRRVAQSWNPWHVPAAAGMPAYQNAQPEYDEVAPNTARIRSGSNAQMYFNTFFTHTGGIFQRVTNITPGAELRFSIYVYVWSSTFEDEDISENPGDVLVDVGIDPTGGTDGTSSNIVWSVPVAQYDAYRQYSVIATAASSAVTVFVRSQVGDPVQNTYIYLDDAVLAVTTEPEIFTDTPVPTNTLVPTNTPAVTNTPDDMGIIPIETDEPEDTAVPEATATPMPTDTLVPTATPVPIDEDPTPTREGDVVEPVPVDPAPPTATATVDAIGGPVTSPFPNSLLHTVRGGDTVGRLAVLYGSTTQAIIQANNLNENALIFVGQGLIIPVPLEAPASVTPSPTPLIIVTATPAPDAQQPAEGTTYIVQPGDTLFRIATRYNTTVSELARLNGIVNANRIQVGQRLLISSAGTGGVIVAPTPQPPVSQPLTYTVRPGDNLYRISLRFNVSLQRLAEVNGIVNTNLIFVGQVLTIP